jgi:hypothetical protein
MSQNAVLNTAELLESILLNLNVKDLVGGRRVSRTWNLLILHSPGLRRALFLDAEPPQQRPIDHRTGLDPATGTWRLSADKSSSNNPQKLSERRSSGRFRVLNTLIFRRGRGYLEAIMPATCGDPCEPVQFLIPPDVVKLSKPKQLGGSLVGEMFVCQSPIIKLLVDIEYQEVALRPLTRSGRCLTFRSLKRLTVFNPTGVRIGDIARSFVDAIDNVSTDFKLPIVVGNRPRNKTVLWVLETILVTRDDKAMLSKATVPAMWM